MANTIKATVELDAKGALKEVEKLKKEVTATRKETESLKRALAQTDSATARVSATGGRSKDREEYRVARAGIGTGAEGRDFAKQAQGLGGLVHVYATFAANIFAVTAAYTALDKAFSVSRLEQAADIMSGKLGYSIKNLSKNLIEATGHSISFQEAMQFSAMGTAAGLTGKQLVNLTVIAKGAANALGRDMGDAVRRIVQGTAKQEQEILDELGIFVRAKTAYANYAKTLGLSGADALTATQRVQAYAIAVEEAGAKWKDFAAIDDPFAKFTATFKEAGVELLNVVNSFITPIIKFLSESKSLVEGILVLMTAKLAKMAIPHLGEKLRNAFSVDPEELVRYEQAKLKVVQNYNESINAERLQQAKIRKEMYAIMPGMDRETVAKGGTDKISKAALRAQVDADILNKIKTKEITLIQAKELGLVRVNSTETKVITKAATLTNEIIALRQKEAAVIERIAVLENERGVRAEEAHKSTRKRFLIFDAEASARNREIVSRKSAEITQNLGSPDIGIKEKTLSTFSNLIGMVKEAPAGISRVANGFRALGVASSLVLRGIMAALGPIMMIWAMWDIAIKPVLQSLGFFSEKESKVVESTKQLSEQADSARKMIGQLNDMLAKPISGEDLMQALDKRTQSLTASRDAIDKLISDKKDLLPNVSAYSVDSAPIMAAKAEGYKKVLEVQEKIRILDVESSASATQGIKVKLESDRLSLVRELEDTLKNINILEERSNSIRAAGNAEYEDFITYKSKYGDPKEAKEFKVQKSAELKTIEAYTSNASKADLETEGYKKLLAVQEKIKVLDIEDARRTSAGRRGKKDDATRLILLQETRDVLDAISLQEERRKSNIQSILAPSKAAEAALDKFIKSSNRLSDESLKAIGLINTDLQESYRQSLNSLDELGKTQDSMIRKSTSESLLADFVDRLTKAKKISNEIRDSWKAEAEGYHLIVSKEPKGSIAARKALEGLQRLDKQLLLQIQSEHPLPKEKRGPAESKLDYSMQIARQELEHLRIVGHAKNIDHEAALKNIEDIKNKNIEIASIERNAAIKAIDDDIKAKKVFEKGQESKLRAQAKEREYDAIAAADQESLNNIYALGLNHLEKQVKVSTELVDNEASYNDMLDQTSRLLEDQLALIRYTTVEKEDQLLLAKKEADLIEKNRIARLKRAEHLSVAELMAGGFKDTGGQNISTGKLIGQTTVASMAERTSTAEKAQTGPIEGSINAFEKGVDSSMTSLMDSIQTGSEITADAISRSFRNAASDVFKQLAVEQAKLAAQKAAMSIMSLFGVGGGTGGGMVSLAGSSPVMSESYSAPSIAAHANGGIMSEFGPLQLNKYANGGVASSPQLAVFGEGRMNEAYVPLPDGRSIPVTMEGSTGGGNNIQINVNVAVSNTGTTSETSATSSKGQTDAMASLGNIISTKVKEEIINQMRPSGLLAR